MSKQWNLRSCLIVLLALSIEAVQSVSHQKMTKSVHCPGQVLSRANRSQAFRVRSLLECLTRCSSEEECQSIVFDSDSFLCYLGKVGSEKDCPNMEPGAAHLRFYELVPDAPATNTNTDTDVTTTDSPEACQNGGYLDENGTCFCVNSYVGPVCERIMEDCEDALESGFYTSFGQYLIHPSIAVSPFPVFCQLLTNGTSNSRTMVFSRRNSTFSFNRTWEDYRLGFGDVDGDYWLGLDKLYLLTNSKNYDLRFNIGSGETIDRSFFQSFVLSNRSNDYAFTIGVNYRHKLADCMSELQGARFSTYDVDNDDNSSLNCAAVFGGGWWYNGTNNCSVCNLLGPVVSENGQRLGILGEMFWSGFGSIYPFPLTAYLRPPKL